VKRGAKRALLLGIAVLIALAAAAGSRELLRRLAFFEVRRVELAGARYLTAAEMARALAIPAGASLFDPLEGLTRRAAALPGVLEARVSRRIPGTIRVTVREAVPVALGRRAGELALLDAGGRPLPFDPTRPALDLPLADPDSLVTRVLALVQESEPGLYARIERATRVRRDVALDLAEGRVLVRGSVAAAELADLLLVEAVLGREGRSWQELDARFPPRVVVRGARWSAGSARVTQGGGGSPT
jgi:cell division protein FtsQ